MSASTKALLSAGAAAIAVSAVGISVTNDPAWHLFFDNFHWTISFTVAAILAWRHQRHDKNNDHIDSRWMAYGLIAYALGDHAPGIRIP